MFLSPLWFEQNYVSQSSVVRKELCVSAHCGLNRIMCLSPMCFEQNYVSQPTVVWTELRVSAHCGLNRTKCLSPLWFELNYVPQPNVVWAELRVSVHCGLNKTTYISATRFEHNCTCSLQCSIRQSKTSGVPCSLNTEHLSSHRLVFKQKPPFPLPFFTPFGQHNTTYPIHNRNLNVGIIIAIEGEDRPTTISLRSNLRCFSKPRTFSLLRLLKKSPRARYLKYTQFHPPSRKLHVCVYIYI
jgi:hypothetical protein